jgi:hypothetical protein
MSPSDGISGKYSSCWWLHDHLEFGLRGDLRSCCYQYVNSSGKANGNVAVCRIEGNRFPADKIIAQRQKIHEEIAAGTHEACCECPILGLQEWSPREYLVKYVTMNVWTHCNLACEYCFILRPEFHNRRVDYDVTAVIADMLSGRHLDPSGSITWGGGDISALPEFNDLSRLLLDYNVFQNFKTSAFKLLPGVCATLDKQRGSVEVSVDAGTAGTYARFKGKDAFDRVVTNIIRYREHGPIVLKYIADPCNLGDEDIVGFLSLVRRVDPQCVIVTPEWSASWSRKYSEAMIAQIAKLVGSLRQTGVPVQPADASEGMRLFPKIWPDVERQLLLTSTHG